METCARCGSTAQLLHTESGMVCAACEADREEELRRGRALLTRAITPPVLVGLSLVCSLAGLFPVLGLLLPPLSMLVALVAVVMGGQAIWAAGDERPPLRTALSLGGAAGVLGGVNAMAVGGGMTLLVLLSFLAKT